MLRKGLLTLTDGNQHKGFVKDISKGRIPLKDLKEWAEGDSEELPKPKVLRLPFNLNISFAEGDSEELPKPKGQANEIEDSSADNLDELNEDEDLGEVKDIDEAIRSKKSLPVVRAKDALKSAEVLCASSDEEAVEFYIASGVTKIWKYAYHNEAEAIEEVNNFKVNEYSARVRERFLTQYNGAKALIIPGGYSFSKDGKYYEPNLMQRLIAFRVLTERRVGNFSGTGAGKTLGAILAARVCEARVTIIICPNTVVDIWKDNIKLIYPDSLVYTKEIVSGLGGKNTYIVLNYEMFQQADSEDKVLGLIRNSVDLIVLDEVHYSKQRYEKKSSKRRKLINRLLSLSRQRNPDLRVLGLSATPVINNLYEGKSLLDMILGNKVDLDTKETIPNAVALFEKFTTIGVRQVPEYEIDLDTKFIDVDCSRYLDEIRDIGKGQVLELESILTMARLKTILKEIRPQTVIYTNYVGNVILDLLYCAVKREGYSVGLYTGEYKSGLKPFLDKQIDVLIGSDAIATGVDGLQFVSNRLILNTLPWTNAQYTQLIGRLHRQGQVREKVKVVIPKTYADIGDERWSYCDSKWKRIMYKATIGDCVVDGVIPLGELRSPEQALNDALEWFKRLDAERLDKLVV